MTSRIGRSKGLAFAAGFALLLAAGCTAPDAEKSAELSEEAQEQKNIQLVLDMWKGVITDASPEAVMKYIAPDYIQHNPTLPGGRQGLYDAIVASNEKRKLDPSIRPHTTKRLIESFAKDDLVTLIWEIDVPEPSDPSKTYIAHSFDMFRVKDGMMVEHWDTRQKPAQ